MAELIWAEHGTRFVEAGVERGVFYPPNSNGVPWNGLVAVREASVGMDVTPRYFDGGRYLTETQTTSFEGSIEAFTYPKEFSEYDGSDLDTLAQGQERKTFDMSYRTTGFTDTGEEYFTIHIVYNVLVKPAERSFRAVSGDVSLEPFSWDFTTDPLPIPGMRPSAHLTLSTRSTGLWILNALERVLYGDDTNEPRLPRPPELIQLIDDNAMLKIIDHGDGTWTASGPDEIVDMIDDTKFFISWPSAVYLSSDTYQVSSF